MYVSAWHEYTLEPHLNSQCTHYWIKIFLWFHILQIVNANDGVVVVDLFTHRAFLDFSRTCPFVLYIVDSFFFAVFKNWDTSYSCYLKCAKNKWTLSPWTHETFNNTLIIDWCCNTFNIFHFKIQCVLYPRWHIVPSLCLDSLFITGDKGWNAVWVQGTC